MQNQEIDEIYYQYNQLLLKLPTDILPIDYYNDIDKDCEYTYHEVISQAFMRWNSQILKKSKMNDVSYRLSLECVANVINLGKIDQKCDDLIETCDDLIETFEDIEIKKHLHKLSYDITSLMTTYDDYRNFIIWNALPWADKTLYLRKAVLKLTKRLSRHKKDQIYHKFLTKL